MSPSRAVPSTVCSLRVAATTQHTRSSTLPAGEARKSCRSWLSRSVVATSTGRTKKARSTGLADQLSGLVSTQGGSAAATWSA